jgi:hypothetical protein
MLILAACSRPALPAGFSPAPSETPGANAVTLPPSITPSPADTAAPATDETRQPLPSPDPSPTSLADARAQYDLTARFDYARHHLQVSETVTYTNATGEELSDLLLVVEPALYPAAFHLDSLAWSDGAPVDVYTLKVNRLSVPLPQPLPAGQRLSLSIQYQIDLPPIPPPSEDQHPIPFGYTGRQSNLVDWYPFIPPYRPGTGWLVHNPWYFGEHQVYQAADYRVSILPEYSGELVIAASALERRDGDWRRYELEGARSFAWSASPDYHVFSQTVGSVSVLSYAFPFTLPAGESALQDAARALELYSRVFGPYPYASLSVVEADFLDGMEYSGLFFLSRGFYNLFDGTPQGYLTSIAVHETAHQWWHSLVGNDQALEPWLDEALSTYSERIYYENTYPDLQDWWWEFRVNFYAPTGWVNGSIYDYDGFRPYVNAVYLRGALFLEALRQEVGDEAFFAFLQEYARQYTYRLATRQDFFTLLERYTRTDLSSLVEAYFNPHP